MKVTYINKHSLLKIIPGLFCALAGLGGCKKFVTVSQPQNTVTTVEMFSNDAQAASSIAGVYAQMMASGICSGGTSLYTGLGADELDSYQGVAEPISYSYLTNTLNTGDQTADGTFWQPAYQFIYNANAIMAGVAASTSPGLTDSARKQLTGESKFVRAFAYFYLTNLFGDVPMPLTVDFNKTALLARTAQADVYKQIIQDLEDAQGLLLPNYNVAAGERIRPNKFAAMALLARVYLYQKQWKQADSLASAVIGSSLFSLPTDLTQVFAKNSSESIWQLQPNNAAMPYGPGDLSNFVPLIIWSIDVPPPYDILYLDPSLYSTLAQLVAPSFYLSKGLINAFEPNDKRKTVWTGYTPTPNDPPNFTGDTLLWPYKYVIETANAPSIQYYTVLRLAEQYLIRAEAKAEDNDLTGAASDLNTIRARAGLPPTTASSQSDLLAAIAQENRIEFFAEWGHRWLDLKRTGQANTVLGAIPNKKPWNSYELLYPIPQYELNTDPNMTQNTGYF